MPPKRRVIIDRDKLELSRNCPGAGTKPTDQGRCSKCGKLMGVKKNGTLKKHTKGRGAAMDLDAVQKVFSESKVETDDPEEYIDIIKRAPKIGDTVRIRDKGSAFFGLHGTVKKIYKSTDLFEIWITKRGNLDMHYERSAFEIINIRKRRKSRKKD